MVETSPNSSSPHSPFEGQVALITGVSDRGIGSALTERLADHGAQLFLLVLSEPARLLKRLDRKQKTVAWHVCDITHGDQVQAAVSACIARFGRLDILINNAGVEMAASLEEFDDSQWQQMLDVNLHGAIRVTRAALPHLARPGGVIVNVSSALALGGCPGFSVYSASKAGMNGFTQSLAWELAPERIRVVGVAPGLVHTPMIHKHIEHLSLDVLRQIESCHPLGMGVAQDVAAAVAFLASSEARWITGITIPLGWSPHYPLPVDAFMD